MKTLAVGTIIKWPGSSADYEYTVTKIDANWASLEWTDNNKTLHLYDYELNLLLLSIKQGISVILEEQEPLTRLELIFGNPD